MPVRTVLAWSGGKDAALALRELRADPDRRVHALFTTVSADTGRTTMHGLDPALVEAQAASLSLPVRVVDLPADASNEAYERRMAAVHREFAAEGVDAVAFGDVFLEDVRDYRESNLADGPLEGRWPLWGRDTDALARASVEAFDARVACVDGAALDRSFACRRYDADFLDALPDDVDPCAERGEFHTVVVDGPGFASPVAVDAAGVVAREVDGREFYYCDLRRR